MGGEASRFEDRVVFKVSPRLPTSVRWEVAIVYWSEGKVGPDVS